MKLLTLLHKTSGASYTGAIIAVLISEISSTGLIALVNYAIDNRSSINTQTAINYIRMRIMLLVSMAMRQLLLARLISARKAGAFLQMAVN